MPATVAWLPLIVLPQLLFTMGVAWFLAAAAAYVRDLAHVNGFLLTLWFFLTPICYPEQSLPAAAKGLLVLNPMYIFVRAYRDVLLEGRAPDPVSLAAIFLVSALVFLLGHAFFYKLRNGFADVI